MTNFWNGRRVLVTGCTGFLGWVLTRDLLAKEAQVVGLVRDGVPQSLLHRNGLSGCIDTVRGSVEDYDVVERAINEYDIEVVFHLAAQALVGVANRNPLSTFETNIKGTWVIAEACRRCPRPPLLVIASSDKAYGANSSLPYEEDFPLRGQHPYDVSKSCADLIALSYHKTYGLPVCVTRCGNLFGPGDLNFSRIIPGTIQSILRDQRPVIRSDGTLVRDYVFVDDAVHGYLLLAERMTDPSIRGMAFNLGTGEPVSVRELVHRLLTICNRGDLKPIVENKASGEIANQYLSSGRASNLLGWTPSAHLNQRLTETVRWYECHHQAG